VALKRPAAAAELRDVIGLLAICEGVSGSARVAGIILPPLFVALWAALIYGGLRGTKGEDLAVISGAFVVSVLVSLGVIAALSGNDSGNHVDYATPLIVAGLACVFLAALVGVQRGRHVYRLSSAAALGALSPPGAAILYLAWILSVNGSCLD
jgi:hypothetical protein